MSRFCDRFRIFFVCVCCVLQYSQTSPGCKVEVRRCVYTNGSVTSGGEAHEVSTTCGVKGETMWKADKSHIQNRYHSFVLVSTHKNDVTASRNWPHRRVSFSAKTNITLMHRENMSDQTTKDFENKNIKKWKFVLTNTGDSFNPVTGVMTSPYTAAYRFLLNVAQTGRSRKREGCRREVELLLKHNGRRVEGTTGSERHTLWSDVTGYTLQLQQGDQVWSVFQIRHSKLNFNSRNLRCRYMVTFRGFTE